LTIILVPLLLLDSFFGICRLRQILLQSEDELMVKSNAEPSSEGIAPKPKKLIGKMKVQGTFSCYLLLIKLFNLSSQEEHPCLDILHFAVRKVKMGLDPPTGCSMSSIMTNKVKMDSVRYHFSNLQSSLSAGWQALRRIRFVPRVPANGSLARQSLAYVHASTRYIQQVSGLLKVGVTTLRNNSSSYEVVQGMLTCIIIIHYLYALWKKLSEKKFVLNISIVTEISDLFNSRKKFGLIEFWLSVKLTDLAPSVVVCTP